MQLGSTRKNPDAYALEVMNEVLGGGFAARLFSNVRSKKGLAYSVRGGVGTPGILACTQAVAVIEGTWRNTADLPGPASAKRTVQLLDPRPPPAVVRPRFPGTPRRPA